MDHPRPTEPTPDTSARRQKPIPTIELRFKGKLSEPQARRIGSPREVYEELKGDLGANPQEEVWAVYLDSQNFMICKRMLTRGALNTVRTHPKEVLLPAILTKTLSFILAHNHPSGSLEPSRDDLEFTKAVQRAAEIMGLSLADHLIISHKGYISFKERRLM